MMEWHPLIKQSPFPFLCPVCVWFSYYPISWLSENESPVNISAGQLANWAGQIRRPGDWDWWRWWCPCCLDSRQKESPGLHAFQPCQTSSHLTPRDMSVMNQFLASNGSSTIVRNSGKGIEFIWCTITSMFFAIIEFWWCSSCNPTFIIY